MLAAQSGIQFLADISLNASLRLFFAKFGLASRAPLELDARAKLLAAVHRGAPMGIAASVVLPALTVAAFWDASNRPVLLGWCLIMLCLTASGLRFYFGYRYDLTRMTLAAHTRKWWTGMHVMSAVGGVAWGCSAGLYLMSPSLEFSSLLMIVIIGVAAAAVLSQAPVPSSLLILGTGILAPHFVLAEQAFPGHGLYLRGVLLFFAALLTRHAVNIHNTLVREIQLENESRQLARRYQDEKQRALSASEEKSRFLAAASHDLRQPVHAIVLLVEALRARNQSESLAPLVEQLASGAATIDLLFRSLLDLSKLESRKTSPTLEPVDLGEVITEVVQQFMPDARAKGLTLAARIPPLPVFGMAEPVLLRRALFNLLQNALRYTERGGVMVALRVRQKHLRIEVWDTGIGIAPEHQKDIFSTYYQVENPERDPSQGLGLGLSIYKECVRLLRGTFGVRSVPGRGSMFWMALRPVPAEIKAPLATQPRAEQKRAVLDQPRFSGVVLVVDDDPQIRKAWHALLEAWGVEVHSAADGRSAEQLLARGIRPQIIFCDLRLPGEEDGLQLLERWQVSHPDAHAVLLTGDRNSAALARAEEAGYLLLAKPMDPNMLRVLLKRWLRGRSAEPQVAY
ncbi:Sensor histidine kinase RcsC [Ralstonia edaphis]|uniref:histidine kinase n=1 Tax=Ralstonia edaphi TaxID=3058599 RepID=A0AB72WZE6_9RALS|nr:Sensor histidine kinase RcsC [Ralstonia sp. LMG 6871]